MNQFQYSIYQIQTPKKPNEFNGLFNDLINKIEIYKKQYNLTIKSYLEEKNNELEKAKENYSKRIENADQIYSKLTDNKPDDENTKFYADHKARYEYINYDNSETIESINNKYDSFLDLYSKSLIIALYSLNESKLNDITTLASDVFNKDIKPSHFDNRDYLNSSITYLNLVIGIEKKVVEKYVTFFKEVQFIRNKIVHSESKTKETKAEIKTAKDIVNKHNKSLKFENETNFIKVISSKFLKDFISNLLDFHHNLIIEIDKAQNYQIIRNGLKYWLAPLDKNIFITKMEFEKISPNEKNILFTVSSRKRKIPKFQCKINMKKILIGSFELILQLENETITDFFNLEKEVEGLHLASAFNEINIGKIDYKTTLLVF